MTGVGPGVQTDVVGILRHVADIRAVPRQEFDGGGSSDNDEGAAEESESADDQFRPRRQCRAPDRLNL